LNWGRSRRNVRTVAALGGLGWQETSGYRRHALVGTAMGRYTALIGTRLRARSDAGQRAEAAVGAAVLTECSRPDARTPSVPHAI
jgi:hypothetical protein